MGNIDINRFKNLYNTSPEYEAVRTNPKMQNGVHILCLSGSHSYGTAREDSDVDIRGVVGLNKGYALGVNRDWEVERFSETDTEIYSYKKFLGFMLDGNPSILALLGQEEDDYLYLSDLGKELVTNYDGLILARAVYNSFVGYSNSQLRRLELAQLGRLDEYGNVIDNKIIKEKKISILDNAVYNFDSHYPTISKDNFSAEFDIVDDKVFIKHLEVSDISMVDFFDTARDLKNITSSFGTSGKRNKKKSLFKLNKHCMHLIRGLLMGVELLETGKIVTYRKKDLPLLLAILHGEYMNEDGSLNSAFYDILNESRIKADYAFKNTVLPFEPDVEKLTDFHYRFTMDSLNRASLV